MQRLARSTGEFFDDILEIAVNAEQGHVVHAAVQIHLLDEEVLQPSFSREWESDHIMYQASCRYQHSSLPHDALLRLTDEDEEQECREVECDPMEEWHRRQ